MTRLHLAVLALLSLTACGQADEAAQAPSTAAASEPTAQPAAANAAQEEPPAPHAAAEPAGEAEELAHSDGPPEEPHPYDDDADARAEIDAAVAAAGQDGKKVLLVFGGNWCPWCRRLDYLMKHDAEVMSALDASYHLVHVSIGARHSDTNAAIDQSYGHPIGNGLPVLVVLDAQGERVHTQETGALEEGDHHDPAKVLAFLRRFAGADPS